MISRSHSAFPVVHSKVISLLTAKFSCAKMMAFGNSLPNAPQCLEEASMYSLGFVMLQSLAPEPQVHGSPNHATTCPASGARMALVAFSKPLVSDISSSSVSLTSLLCPPDRSSQSELPFEQQASMRVALLCADLYFDFTFSKDLRIWSVLIFRSFLVSGGRLISFLYHWAGFSGDLLLFQAILLCLPSPLHALVDWTIGL